jgi:hypothetical protein
MSSGRKNTHASIPETIWEGDVLSEEENSLENCSQRSQTSYNLLKKK